jgi:hypothetical protein
MIAEKKVGSREVSPQPIAGDGLLLAMTIDAGGALPSGPFEVGHRSLQLGLRAWVERQTRLPLGYVLQLYTFADSDQHAALIKDNHFAGGFGEAIRRVRAHVGHLVKIEVEVDTLAQLEEALRIGVDARAPGQQVARRYATSCDNDRRTGDQRGSGPVTLEGAPLIAATGVDLISVGWPTHSAPILDVGLDYLG